MESENSLLLCTHDDIHEKEIDDSFLAFFARKTDEIIVKNCESMASCQTLVSNESQNKCSINSSSRSGKSQESNKLKFSQLSNCSQDTENSLLETLSIPTEILEGCQMIQFYENPLLNLPESNNVRCIKDTYI